MIILKGAVWKVILMQLLILINTLKIDFMLCYYYKVNPFL